MQVLYGFCGTYQRVLRNNVLSGCVIVDLYTLSPAQTTNEGVSVFHHFRRHLASFYISPNERLSVKSVAAVRLMLAHGRVYAPATAHPRPTAALNLPAIPNLDCNMCWFGGTACTADARRLAGHKQGSSPKCSNPNSSSKSRNIHRIAK